MDNWCEAKAEEVSDPVKANYWLLLVFIIVGIGPVDPVLKRTKTGQTADRQPRPL